MKNKENSSDHISGYIFVGFMFVGMGVGAAIGDGGIGMFIGMGLGYIVSAMYQSEKNK